jgi:hypothetical protein
MHVAHSRSLAQEIRYYDSNISLAEARYTGSGVAHSMREPYNCTNPAAASCFSIDRNATRSRDSCDSANEYVGRNANTCAIQR